MQAPGGAELSVYESSHDEGPDAMGPKDQALVQLYCAGYNHYWGMLPGQYTVSRHSHVL